MTRGGVLAASSRWAADAWSRALGRTADRGRAGAAAGRKLAAQSMGTLLGARLANVRQSLLALTILAFADVTAGVALGAGDDLLEELPGLLLLVPASTALRGNVFGAMGSRLGTAIHAGTFTMSLQPRRTVGRNVWGSVALTLGMSAALAVLAKAVAELFGLEGTIGIDQFMVVSVLGGILSGAVVLVATLALSTGSARYGWDPDNVTAPLVTAAGDLFTLPALLLAATIADPGIVTTLAAAVLGLLAVASVVAAWVGGGRRMRNLLQESFPVLLLGGVLSLLAGLTFENQLGPLTEEPILLVLLPGYLSIAGALGGILSNRLSSKLHLGFINPVAVPERQAVNDIAATFALALPGFALIALVTQFAGSGLDLAGPGLGALFGAALVGGVLVTVVVVLVAYYGTIVANRFGVDPDTYGIPLVTSALDLIGAFTFIAALGMFGIV